ncbi:MAG: hypothetical protein EOO10_14190, partial [Chitinophagaceae bacterium]
DEDWGLRPWAVTTFEPEKKNIGPKTYAKVFELLLRLKANLLWLAMHPGTAPFYSDPENVKVAAAYGIMIGSSHAEPMLRNNVGEWDEKQKGHFNYITNKDSVYAYWEERVKQSGSNKVVYTLGMRGVHDSGIEGVKTAKEAVPLLERIISDQRNLLQKHHPKDAAEIPKVFTAYKEVLEIYDNGLRLPDDVTIVWPDDNYGYIQRLNNQDEKQRSGGSGVYYHASYWGRPHDYLWLSSTHPSLIREEMMKAYENKTDRLWVLNVGDIKPLEYNIQLFFDMAFDAAPFRQSTYTKTHLQNWAKQVFQTKASEITAVLLQYYDLAFERRPEFMGWSQTEPTTKTTYTSYNHFYYGDEAQRRIDQYQKLQKTATDLRKQIAGEKADAFYQLVYYPVVCAAWMNKKFLYRDKAFLYAKQNRSSAKDYAKLSNAVYDSIAIETEYFNQHLRKGKWNGMMSMKPRDLPVFQAPDIPAINIQNGLLWNVAPEGYDTAAFQQKREKSLPIFTKGIQQKYFIDVYLSGSQPVQWTAEPSASWMRLSQKEGILNNREQKNTVRIWVTIDWNKVPKAEAFSGHIVFAAEGIEQNVKITARQPKDLETFKGHVECNEQISIHANSYVKEVASPNSKWQTLNGLGHTGTSLQSHVSVENIDTVSVGKKAGYITYEFYSFSNSGPNVSVYTLPTHPLNKNYSMRYGISIDDGGVTIVDFKTIGRSEEWKQNVLRNSAVKTVSFSKLEPGRHTLKIYAIDPGVILDRVVINFSAKQKAYSVIPQTIKYQVTSFSF